MNTISVDVYSIIFSELKQITQKIQKKCLNNKKKVLNNSKDNIGIPIDSTTNEMNLKNTIISNVFLIANKRTTMNIIENIEQ